MAYFMAYFRACRVVAGAVRRAQGELTAKNTENAK